jgi:hypothetical protein
MINSSAGGFRCFLKETNTSYPDECMIPLSLQSPFLYTKKGYMIPFHAHHCVFPWALIFPRIVNPREFELEKG